MENIYVLVKFELNSPDLLEDWKKMSSNITSQISGAPWFLFRDSAVDDNGNVYCIIKWETEEQQKTFRAKMDKMFEEQPEIMQEFGRIANMKTMTMEKLRVL